MLSIDLVDAMATAVFLAAVVLIPLAGYVFMAMDFRAYLRTLQRSLILAAHAFSGMPAWARQHTPRPIAALGLHLPCTEEDLKRAYRQRVKLLHPDRGGDQKRFMLLQSQFEEAMSLLAAINGSAESAGSTPR